jgi:prophage regulatory protein
VESQHQYDGGKPIYIDVKAVAARYDISPATAWRWPKERAGFPQPIKLGPGITRWKLAALEAWEQSQEGAPK